MKDLSNGVYSHEEIRSVLHMEKGSREIKFRYDLLNRDEQKKVELTEVISGEISFQAFNTIKRTAKFRIKETNEKIRYARSRTAKWGDYGEITWEDLNGVN